jgi:RNA-directed DNA polymerase
LKCDIRKFFPSLDHAILKKEIRWKIRCKDTLWLIDHIIDNSNAQEAHIVYFPSDDLFSPHLRRRGLPIGNLTSQFWANVYMNRFDHFVKETLRLPYIRYVDDFVIFSNDKDHLWEVKKQIQIYLQSLRLITHPHKTQIHAVEKGVPFLGFRVFPNYRYVKKDKTKRSKRFIQLKIEKMQQGIISPNQLEAGLNSWLGHIRFGKAKYMENTLFNRIRQQNVNLVRHPNGSWRILELPNESKNTKSRSPNP